MKIIDGLKYWGQLLLLPIYWLSFLFPRDKHIWLFGSTFGRRFADNPRYLYLYVSQMVERGNADESYSEDVFAKVCDELGINSVQHGVRAIWISRDERIVNFLRCEGYEAYTYHSLKGIWYALRAGVYLFDNYSKDINFWQSGGAAKINLWHGIPLKKIQHDNKHDRFRQPKNMWDKIHNFPRNVSDEKPSDYILSPSRMFDSIFARAFQTEHVIRASYPRWDAFQNQDLCLPKEQKYLNRIRSFCEKRPQGKVLVYMPTFRDSEERLLRHIDVKKMQKFLKEHDLMLIIKLHPKSKIRDVVAGQLRNCSKRIVLVDAKYDSNLLLAEADVLITDYSSCYFDYLKLNRPIVYYDYDYDEYVTQSRELYFDYDVMTAGIKVQDVQQLRDAIVQSISDTNFFDTERKRIREQLYGESI